MDFSGGEYGGGDRSRTRDILLAKQALYQLSYAPTHESTALSGVQGEKLGRMEILVKH